MLLFNWLGTSRWQEQGRWSHTDSIWRWTGPWRGMWQLSAPRLTLTLISPCRVLAVWRRCQPLAKRRNMPNLQSHYDFQPIAVETLGPINESATSNFAHERGQSLSFCFSAFWSPSAL